MTVARCWPYLQTITVQPGSVVGCSLASTAVAGGVASSEEAATVTLAGHRVAAACFNQGVP